VEAIGVGEGDGEASPPPDFPLPEPPQPINQTFARAKAAKAVITEIVLVTADLVITGF
jgi:hypothetical protein